MRSPALHVVLLTLVVGCGFFKVLGTKAHAAERSSQKTSMTRVRAQVDGGSHRGPQRIAVALINEGPLSIYSVVQSTTPLFGIRGIQRRTTGPQNKASWEELDPFCKAPACKWDIEGPGEIKPKQRATFSWAPVYVAKGAQKSTPLSAGCYRLEIAYQAERNGAWLSVLSNEFIIE